MDLIINNRQRKIILEELKKSTDSSSDRFEYVANKVIELMDLKKLTTIPKYRFLQNLDKETNDILGVNMKTMLAKYLNKGEYSGFVKPIIKKKRPEVTFSTNDVVGANSYLVDDGVAVKSLGEVITYNAFKMNDIKLEYENPEKSFYYMKPTDDGYKILQKHPDFYWPERDLFIEVAGLRDQKVFGSDYLEKLRLAKNEIEKTGAEMVILDYFTYKDNPQGFYKYVCQNFGFDYDPDDFWLSISYEGMQEQDYLNKVKEIINKGGKKTRGEQDMLKKIVTRYLVKLPEDPNLKPIGYKNVKEFKKDTGIGLKFGDDQLRKLAQVAWCESSGSNVQTYEKFKELFGDKYTLSKNTIELMKSKFPKEFDMNKRGEICSNVSI